MTPVRKKRVTGKLSARGVETVTGPGRHSDGGNLYLVVDPSGAKRWVFVYRWKEPGTAEGAGRIREMGLGPFAKPSPDAIEGRSIATTGKALTLADARGAAEEARRLLREGRDPIATRKATQAASDQLGTVPTFGAVADELIAEKTKAMRSDKSVARMRRALKSYAADLSKLPVNAVSPADVIGVLKPLWARVPASAQATQRYIKAVLDAAKALHPELGMGDNPARWEGHLERLLTVRAKLTRGHHAAMDFADVPAFVGELRQRSALAASALEFTILTVARTSEALDSRWSEIDLENAVWTVPAERMKAGVEHRVPLTPRAIEILTSVRPLCREDGLIFPGAAPGKPLSNMAMAILLQRRMSRANVTVHGFRSSFKDWAGDATDFPRELAEMALAHRVGDETEQAYRRRDALSRRRVLMEAWATYCEPKPANVVSLHGGRPQQSAAIGAQTAPPRRHG
jgi:integrase